MRELSEIDVIKALPLDSDLRTKLLSEFDGYDEAKKYAIMRVCTSSYNQMKRVLRTYWEARIEEEVVSGVRKADNDINTMVEEALWKDIEERIAGEVQEQEELSEIRAQLEKFMKEQT